MLGTTTVGRLKKTTFDGRTIYVSPITFNGLCAIEEKFGDIAEISTSQIEVQRFILSIVLRNEDGSPLGDESEIGDMLTLDNGTAVAEFVREVFVLCGLNPKIEDAEGDSKNEEAVKKGRKSSTSPSA